MYTLDSHQSIASLKKTSNNFEYLRSKLQPNCVRPTDIATGTTLPKLRLSIYGETVIIGCSIRRRSHTFCSESAGCQTKEVSLMNTYTSFL